MTHTKQGGYTDMDFPEIIEAFDASFRDDPYGTFVAIMREVAQAALDNEGAMNGPERATVIAACNIVNLSDPDADLPNIDMGPKEEQL